MNEFMSELNSMKTIDFWNQFINDLNRKSGEKTTNTTTTETTREEMSTSFAIKPKFSSSSFFDPKSHPTIKEQVVLCRQIARQLVCDESNAKSKGREMFEKRVQKSSKWVTTTDDQIDDHFHDTTISEGPPNLRLLLDPRHVQDLNSLDFESNETEIIRNLSRSQSQSKEIFSDLTSPDIHPNRGNALFAKRQQKSSEWIVEKEEEPEVALEGQWSIGTLGISDNLIKKYSFRDFNRRAVPFARTY